MWGSSMSARDELLGALRQRYGETERSGKSRILDEFVLVTGHHWKHAIRLLRGSASTETREGRSRKFKFGDEVRDAVVVLWEASDRICGKRRSGKARICGASTLSNRLKRFSPVPSL